MNPGLSSVREVPVDVLPPVPRESDQVVPSTSGRAPFEGLKTFYHPASGVVVLALDWLLFSTDLLTGFLALLPMCILGFLVTYPLVYAIQRKWAHDTTARAMSKALLGAVMVALPFPVTGTLLGAGILALSGLPHHPVEMMRKLVYRGSAK